MEEREGSGEEGRIPGHGVVREREPGRHAEHVEPEDELGHPQGADECQVAESG